MIERTSIPYAPWPVIGSNDNNHFRIMTLKTFAPVVHKRVG